MIWSASAGAERVSVPFARIENISYEYTNKHRVKQAVLLGMVTPWSVGAVVGFTKSKNHWLEFDFHDQDVLRALVVKLDKRNYQKVCDAAKAHTGKDVAMIGKTDTKTIKGKL